MNLSIFDFHTWRPLAAWGLEHPFFTLHIDTLFFTWLAMATLFGLCKLATWSMLNRPKGMISFGTKYLVNTFLDLATETIGSSRYDCFTFAAGLFLFVLFCNIISSIPYIEESTRDLNTTLAIGICSFVFVQYQGIKAHGLHHFNEFLEPFFLLLPLNIIGELAKIASMSFRLFGNILAGSVILQLMLLFFVKIRSYLALYTALVIVFAAVVHWGISRTTEKSSLSNIAHVLILSLFFPATIQIFFGLFEGLVQALVIGILTLTYTGITLNREQAESDHTQKGESGT